MTTATISANDTAKALRAALKANFPGVKFSVRQTPGGSIRVEWFDGPTRAAVERIADRFAGSSFDGMTDMKSPKESVQVSEGGELVRVQYRVDFVLCERRYTAAYLTTICEAFAARYGWGAPTVIDSKYGASVDVWSWAESTFGDVNARFDWQSTFNAFRHEFSA